MTLFFDSVILNVFFCKNITYCKGEIELKELLKLYLLFVKMGSVCFGGGYAMLPILERELVTNRGWCTKEELIDYYAIGQCTPGVIAVNTSTFIGHKLKGIPGGIVATLGFVTPSIVIISLIATILQYITDLPVVTYAFGGIRICVCVLIISATVKLWKSAITNKTGIGIFLVVFLLSAIWDISPVVVVISAGLFGFIYRTVAEKMAGGKNK